VDRRRPQAHLWRCRRRRRIAGAHLPGRAVRCRATAAADHGFRPQHASHTLHGRTVGLVGYGRIAHNVEQRLRARAGTDETVGGAGQHLARRRSMCSSKNRSTCTISCYDAIRIVSSRLRTLSDTRKRDQPGGDSRLAANGDAEVSRCTISLPVDRPDARCLPTTCASRCPTNARSAHRATPPTDGRSRPG
jgi:hypothetical protein